MNNEVKTESNNLDSFSSISLEETNKKSASNNSYTDSTDRKNEGNNDWASVPRTYDKEESFHKHEKTATNNQWCSTNK